MCTECVYIQLDDDNIRTSSEFIYTYYKSYRAINDLYRRSLCITFLFLSSIIVYEFLFTHILEKCRNILLPTIKNNQKLFSFVRKPIFKLLLL